MSLDLRTFVEHLDRLSAEIAVVRAEATRFMAPPYEERSSDDEWVDTATVVERLGVTQHAIRKAGKKYGFCKGIDGRYYFHFPTTKSYVQRENRRWSI